MLLMFLFLLVVDVIIVVTKKNNLSRTDVLVVSIAVAVASLLNASYSLLFMQLPSINVGNAILFVL